MVVGRAGSAGYTHLTTGATPTIESVDREERRPQVPRRGELGLGLLGGEPVNFTNPVEIAGGHGHGDERLGTRRREPVREFRPQQVTQPVLEHDVGPGSGARSALTRPT